MPWENGDHKTRHEIEFIDGLPLKKLRGYLEGLARRKEFLDKETGLNLDFEKIWNHASARCAALTLTTKPRKG